MEIDQNFIKNFQKFASQFSGGYTGEVRPAPKRIYRTPPALERKIEIGKDEKYGRFTILKMWLHHPTYEFPNAGLFFGLNNNKSSFTKLSGLEEVDHIIHFLQSVREELSNIYPTVKAEEVAVQAARRQYDEATKLASPIIDQAKCENRPDSDFIEESL